MKKRKISIDLLILIIITALGCIGATLSAMGVFDGLLFPMEKEDLVGVLSFGLLGLLTALVIFLPIWCIYGYIKMAIYLHKKGKKQAFILWLVIIPIVAAILIVLAVLYYISTHQICY